MATIIDDERFDIGRVVNRAFGAIGRNIGLFAFLAVVLEIAPTLLIRAAQTVMGKPGAGVAAALVTIVSGLVGLALYALLQASVTHATVVDLDGGKPSLAGSLRSAGALVLPLIGLAIVIGLGIGGASLLLVVPGIIVALMWFVAVPALVEERAGVFAALARSRVLTKGSRWRLFALALVLAIILYLPLIVLSLAGGGVMAGVAQMATLSATGITLIILNGLTQTILCAVAAASYIELRMVKDGATAGSLASIFA